MKPAAPEVRSAVEPEPGQDQDPTPDRPVLAIPGATIGLQVLWLAGPVFVEQSSPISTAGKIINPCGHRAPDFSGIFCLEPPRG